MLSFKSFAGNQKGGTATLFAISATMPIDSRAVAVQDAQTSFAGGSRLLKLDGGLLNSLLGGATASAATPLDQIPNGVLGTLGIGPGQADSWVSGVRCGGGGSSAVSAAGDQCRGARRHARPCGEHPRLERDLRPAKTWMAGTSPTMTMEHQPERWNAAFGLT